MSNKAKLKNLHMHAIFCETCKDVIPNSSGLLSYEPHHLLAMVSDETGKGSAYCHRCSQLVEFEVSEAIRKQAYKHYKR